MLAAITGLLLSVFGCGTSGSCEWVGFAIFCATAVLLPTAYVLVLRLAGRIPGLFIPNGRERVRPLLVAAGGCLVGFVALGAAPTVGPIRILLLWYGLFGLLAAGLAGHRHMSLHAAGSWGPVVCLMYCFGAVGGLLVPLALLVTWARYALGAHSAGQLAGGALAGATSALATFAVAGWLAQLC